MNILGYYVPSGSIIHKLDPRVKIVVAISLSMVVLHAGPPILIAAGIFLGAVMILSRLSLPTVARALKSALPLPVLILLLHLLFTKGTPLPPFLLGNIMITYQGLVTGTLLAGRFLLLFLGAMLLTMVTLPSEMIRGMEKLLWPLELIGIPTSDLAMMLSLALRFVPVIFEEIEKIREAQSARGADFHRGHPLQRVKTATSIIMPLAFNTCNRAEELTSAMEARGYQGGPRSYLSELTMTLTDYLIIAVAVATAVYLSLLSKQCSVLRSSSGGK